MSIINTNMNKEYKIKAEVLGKPWEFTEEEFKFVKQLLGEPSAVSKGCEVIYIF